MYCPACGNQVNDEFCFCPHCGGRLPQVLDGAASTSAQESMTQYYVGGQVEEEHFPSAAAAPSSKEGMPPRADGRTPESRVSSGAKPGMKWYKFVVWVQLFLCAAVYILVAMSLFSGVYPSYYYDIYDGLQTLNVFTELLCVTLAVLSIWVRRELSRHARRAPQHYLALSGAGFALPLFHLLIQTAVMSSTVDSGGLFQVVFVIAIGAAFVHANKTYFDKRSHLFVN